MNRIDLNCDLGEGFSIYKLGLDEEILKIVSSANIACGFHAGDPHIMKKTVNLALKNQVAIGAHPGFPDRLGFGRRNMAVTPDEAYDFILYQLGALDAFVRAEGGKLQHVKPHGALYNLAAKNKKIASAIAKAIYRFDPNLILFGLSGSELIEAGQETGLKTANEIFADRTYQADGTLLPRSQKNSVITEIEQAVSQTLFLVKEQKVKTAEQTIIDLQADTLCLHSDNAQALQLAQKIKAEFSAANIAIKNFQEP